MKRVKIALLILIFLCFLTLASGCLIHHSCCSLVRQLDRVLQLCEQGQFAAAQASIQELNRFYARQEHLLALFLRRDALGTVSVSLAGLSAYALPENLQDLQSEIEKAKAQVLTLYHLFFSFL